MIANRALMFALLSMALCFMVACGANTRSDPPDFSAPIIAIQPDDQSTPLGQTATFEAKAWGKLLQYQWTRNGVAIAGAIASSYTTPAVTPEDDGASFAVTISNSLGSVTTRSAILRVGPRSPKTGDLRFQLVGSPITMNGYGQIGTPIHFGMNYREEIISTNQYGTPLATGSNCSGTGSNFNCVYFFQIFLLPVWVPDLTVGYRTETFDRFDSWTETTLGPDKVVTSLILEPANNDFALSWLSYPGASGFDRFQQTVAPADLQDFASAMADMGRVITAASFDGSGNIFTVSYAWQQDPETRYESKVAITTFDNVVDEAYRLSSEGYIISALGAGDDSPEGTPTNGFVLVGTRVRGDTMARPLKAAVLDKDDVKAELWDHGYAIVGYIQSPKFEKRIWIGQK